MNRDQIMKAVKQELPNKRWVHTLGVMKTAVSLAKTYGADPVKADLAALMHDYVKYWPMDKMRQVILEQGLPQELLDCDWELWHAPVGAYAAKQEFGIEDEEILDAIRYHTSGRENMTTLDKVVCLADYIEPGRDFPGVNDIRKLAKRSLDKALAEGFDTTLLYLISKHKPIFPLTLLARNSLIKFSSKM
ncbi:MAG TPA: bis(5'-nucleosyl)-tetraphosphatase (symmetrical) YqeK [Bacilli bacterium]